MSIEAVDPDVFQDVFGFVDPDERQTEEAAHHGEVRSLRELWLEPGEERVLDLIIPPRAFPERGRIRDFQIHYQTDEGLPVSHHLRLSGC